MKCLGSRRLQTKSKRHGEIKTWSANKNISLKNRFQQMIKLTDKNILYGIKIPNVVTKAENRNMSIEKYKILMPAKLKISYRIGYRKQGAAQSNGRIIISII